MLTSWNCWTFNRTLLVKNRRYQVAPVFNRRVGSMNGEIRIRSRGMLPHWESKDAIYFVTFRLADSLPQHVIAQIAAERAAFEVERRRKNGELSEDDVRHSNRLYKQSINRSLDSGIGECYLAQPPIAEMVKGGMTHFDRERYRLHAWCIMPNHVHLVMELAPQETLSKVMHSIKRYTARKANQHLGRTGSFWQHEYYDHIIRDEAAYNRIVEYVLNNPSKAGLMDWPWVSRPCDAIGWRETPFGA